MDYFPHDTRAMTDDKIIALRMRSGLPAIAVYYAILEKIYAEEKPFEASETNVGATSVSLILGIGFDELRDYVSTMVEIGLFERDVENENAVICNRAKEHIAALERKREVARQNGKTGGRKPKGKTSGNRKRTDVGSKPKTDEEPTSPEIKPIGFYKKNQIGKASGDAAVAVATPPSAKDCSNCGAPMERTGIRVPGTDRHIWRCTLCAEEESE